MFTIEKLAKRKLVAIIPLEDEQEDGTYNKEDFRVVFFDMPSAEHAALVEECDAEAVRLQTEYSLKKSAAQEQIEKDREAMQKFAVQLPSAESAKNGAAKKIKELETTIAEQEKVVAALPFPPSGQILYHTRIVHKLPDLIGDGGTVADVSTETFQRLGDNMNRVINQSIWEKRLNLDIKK